MQAGERRSSGDDGFLVSAAVHENVLMLVVQGDLDLGSAAHWNEAVTPLLDPPRPEQVHVDLTNVVFMDSSGLGLLVALRQWSEANSVALRLCNVPRTVLRVLDFSGVTPLFDISAAQLEPD